MRLWSIVLLVAACEGPAGPPGGAGSDGTDGSDGDPGSRGDPGLPGTTPWVVADQIDIAVTDLTFDGTGAHVAFTLADKDGAPLDRTGTLTPNQVTVSFVLAQLALNGDGTPAQYSAYTQRVVAGATQATSEGIEA